MVFLLLSIFGSSLRRCKEKEIHSLHKKREKNSASFITVLQFDFKQNSTDFFICYLFVRHEINNVRTNNRDCLHIVSDYHVPRTQHKTSTRLCDNGLIHLKKSRFRILISLNMLFFLPFRFSFSLQQFERKKRNILFKGKKYIYSRPFSLLLFNLI